MRKNGLFCWDFGLENILSKIFLCIGASQRMVPIQARIAQLVAYRLGTGEVPGSNPGKGENFSMKISN